MTRGARGLVNHLVAGTCGAARLAAGGAIEGAAAGSTSHVHDVYESAIYTVSGETEVWHGEGLRHRVVVTAAVSLYVPPGTPHLPVNRSEVTTVAVVARTDPREQESVVTLSLPRTWPTSTPSLWPPGEAWPPPGHPFILCRRP